MAEPAPPPAGPRCTGPCEKEDPGLGGRGIPRSCCPGPPTVRCLCECHRPQPGWHAVQRRRGIVILHYLHRGRRYAALWCNPKVCATETVTANTEVTCPQCLAKDRAQQEALK